MYGAYCPHVKWKTNLPGSFYRTKRAAPTAELLPMPPSSSSSCGTSNSTPAKAFLRASSITGLFLLLNLTIWGSSLAWSCQPFHFEHKSSKFEIKSQQLTLLPGDAVAANDDLLYAVGGEELWGHHGGEVGRDALACRPEMCCRACRLMWYCRFNASFIHCRI